MHVAPAVSALELDDVSFAYRGGPPALEHVSLAVEQGAFLGIAGPNGGGKTTLLRLALGLERPTSGAVRVFGRSSGARGAPRVAYVAQRAQLATGTPVTVRETVETGRLAVRGAFGPLRAEDRRVVEQAIERVGLEDRAGAPLRTLSGGMQQRAFIARALAAEPALLALDEPTTGVDASRMNSSSSIRPPSPQWTWDGSCHTAGSAAGSPSKTMRPRTRTRRETTCSTAPNSCET